MQAGTALAQSRPFAILRGGDRPSPWGPIGCRPLRAVRCHRHPVAAEPPAGIGGAARAGDTGASRSPSVTAASSHRGKAWPRASQVGLRERRPRSGLWYTPHGCGHEDKKASSLGPHSGAQLRGHSRSARVLAGTVRERGDVPKWLRGRSAKPLCVGPNPTVASIVASIFTRETAADRLTGLICCSRTAAEGCSSSDPQGVLRRLVDLLSLRLLPVAVDTARHPD